MKCCIVQDEWYPVLSPEQADKDTLYLNQRHPVVEVPEELLTEYREATIKFERVQDALAQLPAIKNTTESVDDAENIVRGFTD